jgi:hypothetical protein
VHVEEDEVRRVRERQRDRLDAVGGLADDTCGAAVLEESPQEGAGALVVVGHDEPEGHPPQFGRRHEPPFAVRGA